MASPSPVARSRRPIPVDPDDAVSARAAELMAWGQKNARVIIGAAVVLALVVIGIVGYVWNQRTRAVNAAAEYANVAPAVQQGLQGVPRLEGFIRQYDGTTEADEARLGLAEIYANANQPQKALPYARAVAGSGGPLDFQGKMTLAALQARSGDSNAAVQGYLDVAEGSTLLYQRQQARDEAAKLREAAGDWKGAAALYAEMIKDTEEGTADRAFLEMRLAEAQARAGGGR